MSDATARVLGCALRRGSSPPRGRLAPALSALLLALSMAPRPALAQWSPVSTGIDYREFTVSGPNRVFVARMQRSEPSVTIDSLIAQGRLSGGRETVSGMVARYDQSTGYWGREWGQRYEAKVAINGNFFDLTTGVPEGGQILSGWYAWRLGDWGGRSGFAWTLNRTAFIGACIHPGPDMNYLTFADQTTQAFDDINTARGADDLILYTTHYDARTPAQSSGVEVLVEMERPASILPKPAMAYGTVVAIRPGQGETPLYFDHLVLSAGGTAATTLQAHVQVGDRIGVTQEFGTYQLDCNTPDPVDWTNAYANVGGNFQFLRGGVVQPTSDAGLTVRNPRTAIALDSTYIYFLVVDGRTTVSVGMTMTELGNFCLSELGATDGVNHDGGGSSAIWVDGQIKNSPSDGAERTVANGIMMARVLPRELSPTYLEHDTVATTSGAELRLGPGTHFASLSTVSSGTQGTVLGHSALGVRAKGTHWWRVDFAGQSGWVDEAALQLLHRDPDAGVPPGPDGGVDAAAPSDGAVPTDAAAVPDAGPSPRGAGSGCSCQADAGLGSTGPALALWLFCLAGLSLSRRRRR